MMGEEKENKEDYFKFEGLDFETCSAIGGELDANGKCVVKKSVIIDLIESSGD